MRVWFLVLILVFSNLSFSNFTYHSLLGYLGVGWAYVVDQGLPFLVTFFISFIFLLKNWQKAKSFISSNKVPILILSSVVILVHGLLTNYYFFAEDVYTILAQVTSNERHFINNPAISGYPFFPFVFSFLLFKTYALSYNIVSLGLFLLVVCSLYWFVYVLSNKKLLAFVVSLFFATTPAYLDMFTWQASVQGMSQVLFLGLMSCIFLLYYQKSKNYFFYILSLMFFVSGIHIGFVRIAGIIFPLLFLIFFPFVKNKEGIWKRVLQTLPFLFIWIEFVQMRPRMSLLASPFKILGEKNTSFDVSNYFSPLFYYLDHLFLPASIGKALFPWLKNELLATFEFTQNMSFVYSFGLAMSVFLVFLALVAILRLRSFKGKLIILSLIFIFGNLFYVPLLGSVPKDVSLFDRQFISPAYNPGSRYVFSSAIGVSTLFGLLFWIFLNLKIKLKYIFLGLVLSIVVVNGFISWSSHRKITRSISISDKIFMENFFSMVPRDGKKKIVYSINPKKNMIDVNVGASNWLYGFYKSGELFYTKNRDEFNSLILSNKYSKDNIYAFYSNPETNSFKDVSFEIYGEIINQRKKDLQINFLLTSPGVIVSNPVKRSLNMLNRVFMESEDLNYRIFSEKNMNLKLVSENIIPNVFPYSDIIVGKENKYPYVLWKIISNNYYQPAIFTSIENIPPEFILESFKSIAISDFPLEDKLRIIKILKERDVLMNKGIVTVSNKNEDDERVDEKALVDGLYASDPAPGKDERFYLSKSTPVIFDIKFPYPIVLGRILLNTPKSHAGTFSPKEGEILSSYDGKTYEKVGSMDDQVESGFSPNNGKTINILLRPVLSNFLRLTLSNPGGNLLFDEIVIDNYTALKYSPEQIMEYKNKAFLYIDNLNLLSNLVSISDYNRIPLVYACAEEEDWRKQKQNFGILFPGVWKVGKIDLRENIITVPINCDGTVLRKIIIFGPPYPVTARAERVRIE